MATCGADKIVEVCPTVSDWPGGTFATDPLTTGTESEDIDVINLGSVAVSNNSDTAVGGAITIEFADAFDDTINTKDSHIWMMNKPTFTDHEFAAEYESGALLPAVSSDAVLAGTTAATLAGSPYQTNHRISPGSTTEYDSTENRIATILLQYQAGALAKTWDWSKSVHDCPRLVHETSRTDFDADDRVLLEDNITAVLEAGHFFGFPNFKVFFVTDIGTTDEKWNIIDSVREDTVEVNFNKELIEWRKGRPSAVVHQALSTSEAMITFSAAENVPKLVAQALHTDAFRVAGDRVIRTNIDTNSCQQGVKEAGWVVEWDLLGKFKCRFRINRGTLKPTSGYAGSGDFSETTYEVMGLAQGTTGNLARLDCSDTPVLQTIIPVTYISA